MANWWDTAPMAPQAAPQQQQGGNWWDTAPVAQAPAPVEQPAPGTPPAPQPWYAQAAQAADDIVRLTADGLTYGLADRAAGYLSGTGTEAERARTQEARDRAGIAGTVAEVAGGLRTGLGAARAGLTLMRPALQGMTGATGVAARAGTMAVEGAAHGAAGAAGRGQDITTGAGVGAVTGAGGSVLADGVSRVARGVGGMFNRPAPAMNNDQLRTAGSAAYQAADDAGIVIAPQATQRLSQSIVQDLTEFGYHPSLQPRAGAVLQELDRIAQQPVTLKGLDVMRRIARNAASSTEPSERAIGTRIIGQIDDFVSNLRDGDVMMGDQRAGVAALQQGRDYWSRLRKSEMIDTAAERADLRAASTGSGGNVDNATRQNIRGILDNPNRSRGFTPDEREAMETVVRGTPTQNVLRQVGRLSPQGNGLMAALGIGATAANPVMAAVPAVGFVAKQLADRGTARNVERLSELVRGGGNQAALTPPPNALQRLSESQRETLARLLMSAGIIEGTRAVSP